MKGNKYAHKRGGQGGGDRLDNTTNISTRRVEVAGGASKKEKRFAKKMGKKRGRHSDEEDEGFVPPMPTLSASENPWDFRQTQPCENKVNAAKKKQKGSGSDEGCKTCPAGHALSMFHTPHDEFFCELCGDDQYLPAGARLFGCRECDWDACEAHTHEEVKRRELAREVQMQARSLLYTLISYPI
jgi:hypothetical protein